MTFSAEYRTVDKSSWQRGPWDDEPDKAQWQDQATDLPCLLHRSPVGMLCGYVGVPPGHPWHGVDYADERLDSVIVHGGLTFAAGCQHGGDPSHGICHVPEPGEPDDVWWLGFDCGHLGDLTDMKYPLRVVGDVIPGRFGRLYDVYRDADYVRAECTRLAAQVAAAA